MAISVGLWSAVLGPLLVLAALWAHVAMRNLVPSDTPLDVQNFPRSTTSDLKTAIVNNRKMLVSDVLAVLLAKATPEVYKKRFTADAEFENPFLRLVGLEEVSLLSRLCSGAAGSGFSVRGEHHGPHEIVVEWSAAPVCGWQLLPPVVGATVVPITRTRILLEPAPAADAEERVFRIIDEWNGGKILNEKTVFGPLGRIHQKLRRFVGQGVVAALGSGYV